MTVPPSMLRLVLLSTLWALPAAARADAPPFPAGDVALRAYLDPPEAALGQRFHLVLEVRHPEGHRVDLPESLDFGKLHAAGGVDHSVRADGAGKSVDAFRVPLQAFTLDPAQTPAIQLTAPSLKVDPATLAAPALPVSVRRSLQKEEKAEPAPLAPPVALMKEDPRFLAWPPLLLAQGLLWLLVRWLDKKRPPLTVEEAAVAVVVIPPHRVALEKLAALRQGTLVAEGRTQEFVDAVVQVVRGYLEAAYRVPVLELTTQEAVDALGPASVRMAMGEENRRLGRLDLAQVQALLERVDFVKFARAPAGVADCAQAMDQAVQIVETTRPLGAGANDAVLREARA